MKAYVDAFDFNDINWIVTKNERNKFYFASILI